MKGCFPEEHSSRRRATKPSQAFTRTCPSSTFFFFLSRFRHQLVELESSVLDLKFGAMFCAKVTRSLASKYRRKSFETRIPGTSRYFLFVLRERERESERERERSTLDSPEELLFCPPMTRNVKHGFIFSFISFSSSLFV